MFNKFISFLTLCTVALVALAVLLSNIYYCTKQHFLECLFTSAKLYLLLSHPPPHPHPHPIPDLPLKTRTNMFCSESPYSRTYSKLICSWSKGPPPEISPVFPVNMINEVLHSKAYYKSLWITYYINGQDKINQLCTELLITCRHYCVITTKPCQENKRSKISILGFFSLCKQNDYKKFQVIINQRNVGKHWSNCSSTPEGIFFIVVLTTLL